MKDIEICTLVADSSEWSAKHGQINLTYSLGIFYHRNLKNENVHTAHTPYICTILSNSLQSLGMPPNGNFVVLRESILTCEVVRRNSGISELKARVEAEVRPCPVYGKRSTCTRPPKN